MMWLTFCVVIICGLGLLQYNNIIDVQAKPYVEAQDYTDANTGLPIVLTRLCSVGNYDNPNDLGRILIVGIVLCVYDMTDRRLWILRFAWVGPLILLCYGLYLTYSRGAFLGLLAGIATMTFMRLGPIKSIVIGVLLMPAIFFVFAGRITNIDVQDGTGKQRVELWRDGFEAMHSSPIYGIGSGQMQEISSGNLIAHNSFVQGYVETGVLGGIFFTGAFYLAAWGPYRFNKVAKRIPDKELQRILPYLLAILCECIVGMLSSTRNLRVDTYLLLAMSTAFLALIERYQPSLGLRLNGKLVLQVFVIGVALWFALELSVRLIA
jgi:O-antigen ligase